MPLLVCYRQFVQNKLGVMLVLIRPFIETGDQYNFYKAQVVRSRKGEIVVVDRTLTLQYIYNLFYWQVTGLTLTSNRSADWQRMTNIAALVLVPSTFLERLVGFWAAYLIGPAALCIALGLLIIYRKSFGKNYMYCQLGLKLTVYSNTKLSCRLQAIFCLEYMKCYSARLEASSSLAQRTLPTNLNISIDE